jgi:hypothetical protein
MAAHNKVKVPMKPSEPGWYWYRSATHEGVEIVRVDYDPRSRLVIVTEYFFIDIDRLGATALWGPQVPDWTP